MNKKLRKSLMAILGIAALTGFSTQASAISVADLGTLNASTTSLLKEEISGAKFGWDGQNNGYLGWTHSTQWAKFTLAESSSVLVKVAATPVDGQKNVLLPGFTLWATTSAGFVGGNHDPNYSYDANNFYGVTPTHPYNQVLGPPTNLDGQQTPVSPGHGPDCPAGGCNSNNWLVAGAGGFATADGITTLVGYANSGSTGWTNGNGNVVGVGVVGSDNNGPLSGVVDVKGPDWSAAAGGPTNTVQYASLILYNLAAGTYFMAPGGSCKTIVACGNTDGFVSTSIYSIAVTQIAAVPVPAAVWLFASSLAGLGVIGRRRQAGS